MLKHTHTHTHSSALRKIGHQMGMKLGERCCNEGRWIRDDLGLIKFVCRYV
jgi:hypothetical protein